MNVLKEIKVLNEKMFYLLLYSVAFRTLSLPTTQQMTMTRCLMNNWGKLVRWLVWSKEVLNKKKC